MKSNFYNYNGFSFLPTVPKHCTIKGWETMLNLSQTVGHLNSNNVVAFLTAVSVHINNLPIS